MLLDGPHLIEEALGAGLPLRHVLVAHEGAARPQMAGLISRIESTGAELVTASGPVMTAASPVTTSSGIVALVDRPAQNDARVYSGDSPVVIIACDIQDPGNLGAIIRVAEAAGASGVVAAGVSADPYGWKALRGSMGSALRIPVAQLPDVDQAIAAASSRRCRIVATVPRDGQPLFDATLTGPLAILIGGEGGGLPQAIVENADVRLTIPMQAPVESLNAAITAAVLLYEVRRQRS